MTENARPLRIMPTEAYFALVKENLAVTGQARVRVTGISMMPLLRHLKDSVILRPPERIRPGDIVLFDRRNGRYALHRVIRVREGRFLMAGDNQWFVEPGLPCAQVVGVVSAILRGDRQIRCDTLPMKIYAGTVTVLTLPRIYIRRALGRALRLFRRTGGRARKENRE